jgi:hypothetical protein
VRPRAVRPRAVRRAPFLPRAVRRAPFLPHTVRPRASHRAPLRALAVLVPPCALAISDRCDPAMDLPLSIPSAGSSDCTISLGARPGGPSITGTAPAG